MLTSVARSILGLVDIDRDFQYQTFVEHSTAIGSRSPATKPFCQAFRQHPALANLDRPLIAGPLFTEPSMMRASKNQVYCAENRMTFDFQNSYTSLPEQFYRSVQPTPVTKPSLFALNKTLASELHLDVDELVSTNGAQIFSGNEVPGGAFPLAMAYAGHQFGQWVPQLGDGRAVLLGEVKDIHGQLQDIQLKGAGRTPFSRGGDGRAWIGPVIREYVVSEAMHNLGVPTTRALAAVSTGEAVLRESGPLPGAVLTRVASSHLRVGTFEYFAHRNDQSSLSALVDFALSRHSEDTSGDTDTSNPPALRLLSQTVKRQAALIAHWQSIGFIHGVMNTDNSSIAGITIDYGPCAFMDNYSAEKVFSSIDIQGRYAYQNQPRIGHWNMASLAQALLPLIDENQERAVELAQAAVNEFPDLYIDAYLKRMRPKLGLNSIAPSSISSENDLKLIHSLLQMMDTSACDFTNSFRQLSMTLTNQAARQDWIALFDDPQAISDWMSQWGSRVSEEDLANQDTSCLQERMNNANPAIIARNHRIEEAIVAATEQDDFAPFHALNSALQTPFMANPKYAHLAQAPTAENAVTQTFCGT